MLHTTGYWASIRENFEGIAGLRTCKTFKIAGPASLLVKLGKTAYVIFLDVQTKHTTKHG